MASPQLENGYTPIANELIEAIYSARFNATQLSIILFVARFTFGFSRKEHSISLNFIARGTGISRRYISIELNNLITARVIDVVTEHTDTKARVLALNKDYEKWESRTTRQQVKITSTGEEANNTTGEEFFNTTGEEFFHQDNQNIKQNIKQGNSGAKKRKNKNQEAADLFEYLWRLYPRKRGKGSVSDSKKRELFKIGQVELERCIERFKAEMEREGRPADCYPYGGTFFNGGFMDYMDENYQPPADQGERGPMHR